MSKVPTHLPEILSNVLFLGWVATPSDYLKKTTERKILYLHKNGQVKIFTNSPFKQNFIVLMYILGGNSRVRD